LPIESPGIFQSFFSEEHIQCDTVELDAGQPIPDLAGYDALWVMGGPMDVWEEDKYPWLIPEKAAIRECIEQRDMPFFGWCLGHQLLADALRGVCKKMTQPEIGVFKVQLTEAGRSDRLFAGTLPVTEVLQWHGVEVTKLPPDATVLAESEACAVQALRVGQHAYGIQFHLELTEGILADWLAEPGYCDALEKALGVGGIERFEMACSPRLPDFQAIARSLFDNFIQIVRDWRG
jgi:GMP synthase-like glutamine amidotransferase